MVQKRSPKTSSDLSQWNGGRLIALVAVVFGVIGSFLPWVQLEILLLTVSDSGTNGDGRITLVLFLAGGLALLLGHRPIHATLSMLLCTVAGFVALYDLTNISGYASRNDFTEASEVITAGTGLYVSLAAAVVGLIGSYLWPKN